MAEIHENGIQNGDLNGIHNGDLNGIQNGAANGVEEPKFVIPKAKQAEVNLTDYMRECLDQVASSEGFSNYDLKVDHGSAVGDGFVGLVYKVTIKEIDSDKKLAVVVKFPPQSKARRDDFGAMELFRREVFVYNELLPEFVKFQREKRIKDTEGFFNFPKCYFAEFNEEKDDSVIIMEDLRENGYKLWDKYQPVNFEHTKLLVEALGKLHAISFAMKAQKPELFEKFKAMSCFLTEKFTENQMVTMMAAGIQKAADTIEESNVKGRIRVSRIKDDFAQMMRELTDPKRAEPYTVITHGDCWSNNFMFQYRRGAVKRIVLLDWQISRYCSPVLDLVYFIFVCTDGTLRAKHYDELLNYYHRSLKDQLDHLGGDAMTQFPFTALLRQLKQFGKFGLIMATMLIPMLSTRNDELPDMDYMAENMNNQDPEAMEAMMAEMGKGNDNFKPRLRAAALDAVRLGYL